MSCRRSATGRGRTASCCAGAGDLLNAAGWTVKDGKRVNAEGRAASRSNSCSTERSFEPHHTTFIKNLRVLGIEANSALVDAVQAGRAIKDFDFDIAIARFIYPRIPGSALRNYFSSESPDQGVEQSRRGRRSRHRCAGRKDHCGAKPRRAQYRVPGLRPRVACRPVLDAALEQGVTLDRLLGSVRPSARSSRAIARGAPETWWFDANKAAKIEQAK